MQSTQIAVRLPEELLAKLDQQIPSRFASRADAVRQGLDALLLLPTLQQRIQRHQTGWSEVPMSASAEAAMYQDAHSLIADEPW